MVKDFMGLAQKKVKEEAVDECDDVAASARDSAMHWSFSNQVSPLPQIPSLKGAQQDRPSNTGYDVLASTGYMTITTAETLNSNQKAYSTVIKRNMSLEKQVGNHYTVVNYTSQHVDAHPIHHTHEVKLLPKAKITNHMVPGSMSTPVHQPIITSAKHSVFSSNVNVSPVGGVPIIVPGAVGPSSSLLVGNTDLRNGSKLSRTPAQLTIFYSGLVCTYDDISPEKAQAIMLLAGNGPSMTSLTAAVPAPQVQPPITEPFTFDSFIFNQSHSTAPSTDGHISLKSHAGSQSAGLSTSTNKITAGKSVGVLTSSPGRPEPPKVVCSLRPIPAIQRTPYSAAAVPQARKASLARFLEKRKERVMSAAPYVSKQSTDSSILEPGSFSFSAKS